ncbi:MAG: hypothetical protein H7647_06995 [Candidatus Heimdallarchaeota archaeon]|nr:hypothetical protein [Candidatus Heimdallarchaeota archaeon]MCK4254173.1 hypothetical protein [Candidatus Heimdallarchaeota archaeon]
MVSKLSQKKIVCLLVIAFLLTLGSGTLIFIFNHPYDLYIRLTDITWPPPLDEIVQGENRVTFGVPMTFEIWNPSKKPYTYTTPNMNLLDPQMGIELEENYTAGAYYLFWIFITEHTIKSGISERIAIMMVYIEKYNATIPPSGEYEVWAAIDGNPPFSFKSYKTTILHEINDHETNFENTPIGWGKTDPLYRKITPTILWTLTGGELVTITIIYVIKRKKNKLVGDIKS